MTKHKTTGGTVRPPRPLSAGDIAKHQAPGAAPVGFRSPAKAVNNRFNTDAGGSRPWNKLTKGL